MTRLGRALHRALWPIPSTVLMGALALVLMAVARWRYYTAWAWWTGVVALIMGVVGTLVLIVGHVIVGDREVSR